MEKIQISEETINKILLYSAKSLPDRPSERGMKAGDIKSYFYKFIEHLVSAINTELANIVAGTATDFSNHNNSYGAHQLIWNNIDSLVDKDVELGNSIVEQITAHNGDANSHPKLVQILAQVKGVAENAYDLASGKSKVHPYTDLTALLADIDSKKLTLNAGDMVIFKDKNTPDIAVFTTGQESKPEDDEEITADSVLEEKKSYYYNGITFLALEIGIDTSLLAKASEVEKIQLVLEGKEESIKKVESTASALTLASHTEYNLGLITELAIVLPEDTSELEVIINFRCGSTAPSFDAPGEILFQGDDTLDGRLYPVTNRLYEINIKNVMGILVAKVGASDYEVIE